MQASKGSQDPPGGGVPMVRPYKAARFWIAVWIFLLASLLALWQSPRSDALRPPRWFLSIGWWRYPLELNAASRLPNIECSLNAIQAVPNTSSVWAVGNKGMVVTSGDGGRTWTRKSLEQARAAPPFSPTASPSPLPTAKAQGAFLQLLDLITTAEAASMPDVGEQSKPPQGPPPSSSNPSSNASPPATPSPASSPSASPTLSPEVEPLIAVYFADSRRGEAMGNMAKRYATTDGGETWVHDDNYSRLEHVDVVQHSDDEPKEVLVQLIGRLEQDVRSASPPFSGAFLSRSPNDPSCWVTTQQMVPGMLLRLGNDRGAKSSSLSITLIGNLVRAVSGIHFLADQTNGWFVTTDAFLYRTIDKGLSWQRVGDFPKIEGLQGVFFVDQNRGWVVGANGTILRTGDGGTTWQRQGSLASKSQLNSVSFLSDAQQGWIAGSDGLILSTTDGGATWVHQTQGLEGNGGLYLRFPAPWYFFSLGLIGLLLMWRRIEPPPEPEESVADVLVSDRPLEEAAGDVLAFNTVARGLSRFLRNENTLPPLTIAITGEWGMGKSSLMNLLRADLRSYKFRPVWFNAWHHQKEEHMLASLLENIKLQAVPRWWTSRGLLFRLRLLKIRGWRQWGPIVLLLFFIYVMLIVHSGQQGAETNLAAFIERLLAPFNPSSSPIAEKSNYLTLLPLLAGVVTFVGAVWRGITAFGVKPASLLAGVSRGVSVRGLEAQTSFRQKFAIEFNDVTRALGQRSLLIFIDDLDRCRPENVSETLEAVNFLTTSGECFVVIGMAREYVERCVGRAFKEVAEEMIDDLQNEGQNPDEVAREKRIEFARQYLDKLINIEVPVPSPKQSQSLALLVASTKDTEPARPTGRWQQFKLSLVHLVEQHWRLFPVLLALVGLLFLGYYLALGLRGTGPIIPPPETKTTPSAPAPLPSSEPAGAAPTSSTLGGSPPAPTTTPATTNERPELTPGGRAMLSRGLLPVTVLLLLIWIGSTVLMRRPGLVVKDSSIFVDALKIWHPLVFARQPTPRATKRFMNYVRYLAMRQRRQSNSKPPLEHFLGRLKERFTNGHWPKDAAVADEPEEQLIPDDVLVALAALQHLKPGCLKELPGPTSSPDDVWPRLINLGDPLGPLFDKAWREHQSKFSNWGTLVQYRARFLEMTANVHVR